MKEIISELANGYGKIKRTSKKIEFGTLIMAPMSTIGSHKHKDEGGYKHCEIYFTFSLTIRVNGKLKFVSYCRNSEHYAWNVSKKHSAKIFYIKLWW